MSKYIVRACFLTLCIICVFALQNTFLDRALAVSFDTGLSLAVVPPHPEPHHKVFVSLEAYTIDMIGGSVRWYMDGKEIEEALNERRIDFVAGELGESHTIRALITFQNDSAPLSVETTVTPTKVDIIVEADTYIPTFYKGRALPSSESRIRLVAIPLTTSKDNPSTYSYDWRFNSSPIYGGAVLGKQSIELTLPMFSDETVSVTVYDKQGAFLGSSVLSLDIVEPELHFYEDNLLRGVSRKSIQEQLILLGDEATILAEPYFMEGRSVTQHAEYSWSIDSIPTQTTPEKKNSITLQRAQNAGKAGVSLQISSGNKLSQYAMNFFTIFFQ